mmetsp:Transcript_116131/g.182706  ORF Transcript_116131/g.182706 Transcript_116131/m.182706 type:complete len:155 (+) Transcript_116131:92-556(+)
MGSADRLSDLRLRGLSKAPQDCPDGEHHGSDAERSYLTSSCMKNWCFCGLLAVLACYFLPMLSFIPLALAGGIHLPSPSESHYNNLSGRNSNRSLPRVYEPWTPPSDSWYWDLRIVFFVLFAVPTTMLAVLYYFSQKGSGPALKECEGEDLLEM